MLTYFLTELQEVSIVLILMLSTKKPKHREVGMCPRPHRQESVQVSLLVGHSMDSLTMD